MDFLFLCHYSYGDMAYSHAILVAGAYSYGPIPMDLMVYSFVHFLFPDVLFLRTYCIFLCDVGCRGVFLWPYSCGPYGLFPWTFSFSCAIIPMDLMAYCYGPIPMAL